MFDRVIYRPAAGFPNENELVLNMMSAVGCCVACQTTVSSSGFLPGFVVLIDFSPTALGLSLRLVIRSAISA